MCGYGQVKIDLRLHLYPHFSGLSLSLSSCTRKFRVFTASLLNSMSSQQLQSSVQRMQTTSRRSEGREIHDLASSFDKYTALNVGETACLENTTFAVDRTSLVTEALAELYTWIARAFSVSLKSGRFRVI